MQKEMFFIVNKPKTTADLTYEQYEKSRSINPESVIPTDDLRDVNTITTQSISELPLKSDVEYYSSEDVNETALEDVPDADVIQRDSPIDPATPPIIVVHGTDLLNGYHNEEPED
ncbi:hypothetical protein ACP8HI_11545 [Paenibacillus sp. FA6]|uniref:hypothetical protein n=1 Tax=Paenibacillus sp. FA6 TaxID=3413029 RepID=UPI003F65D1A5